MYQTTTAEPSFSDPTQRWVLHAELGRGTYGRVDSWRNRVGTCVAVKSSGFKREFRKEVRIMRKLKGCPNIIRYYDHVFHHHSLFDSVMMELGKSNLFDYIRRPSVRLRQPEIRQFFLQALNGVSYMHQLRITHLDLKSGNMIIGVDNQLKIADFGLSEEFLEESRQFRGAIGTHQICAPEAFTAQYYDGPKSDIWALGVLLLEMRHRRYLWTTPEPHDHGYAWFLNGYSLNSGSDQLAKYILHGDIRKRPEIEEIRRHPWLNNSGTTLQKQPVHSFCSPTPCFQSILMYMGF